MSFALLVVNNITKKRLNSLIETLDPYQAGKNAQVIMDATILVEIAAPANLDQMSLKHDIIVIENLFYYGTNYKI